MGLNPMILRQFGPSCRTRPSDLARYPRRSYRASGLVLTSIRDIQSVATNVRMGRCRAFIGRPSAAAPIAAGRFITTKPAPSSSRQLAILDGSPIWRPAFRWLDERAA